MDSLVEEVKKRSSGLVNSTFLSSSSQRLIHVPLFLRYKDKRELPEGKKYSMSYDGEEATLKIRDVMEKDSGEYTCEATNALGTVTTVGQLTVQGKENIPTRGLVISQAEN